MDREAGEQVEIGVKYQGYIDRQKDEADRLRSHENQPIPSGMRYADVKGLSKEVEQKLEEVKPETLGQASRISGVTPAAISLLLIHIKRRGKPQQKIA